MTNRVPQTAASTQLTGTTQLGWGFQKGQESPKPSLPLKA